MRHKIEIYASYNSLLSEKCNFELWDERYGREQLFSSYLDLLLSIVKDGRLHTSLHDKRDNLNLFPWYKFSVYFISQLIRYDKVCSSNTNLMGFFLRDFSDCFLKRDL